MKLKPNIEVQRYGGAFLPLLKVNLFCCHNYGVLLFINCLQYFLILYSLYLSENMACLFVLIFM